jgi:hypothetical protein
VVADVDGLQHGEGGWLGSSKEGIGGTDAEEEDCTGE